MAMNLGSRGALNADINVTPLVDVMLVLLIIMMLVAPMLQQGVPVRLPLADNTVQKPETQEQTVLAVDRDNKFYVNSIEVDKGSMADRVKAALEDKTERIVLIRADQDSSYSAIMTAMDDLRRVGIEDIGLITDPKTRQPDTPGGK